MSEPQKEVAMYCTTSPVRGNCRYCGKDAGYELREVTEERNKWKELYEEGNREWIRVLTYYVPAMKLPVYSPRTVGEWLKRNYIEPSLELTNGAGI